MYLRPVKTAAGVAAEPLLVLISLAQTLVRTTMYLRAMYFRTTFADLFCALR